MANPRVHATTRRVVNEAFAEEKLQPLPAAPFCAVLKLERRVSLEGMVSVGGNLYSVPDATHKRVVEVPSLANEILQSGSADRDTSGTRRASSAARRPWPSPHAGDAGGWREREGPDRPRR